MFMMRTMRPFVLGAALFPAMSALAQPVTPFTQAAAAHYNTCLEGSDTLPAAEVLQSCNAAEQGFVALRAENAGAYTDEMDYVIFMHVAVQSAIAGAATRVDGARSARVCDAIERSWRTLADISPATSYGEIINSTAERVANTVRLCRSEKGTPSWARPLP